MIGPCSIGPSLTSPSCVTFARPSGAAGPIRPCPGVLRARRTHCRLSLPRKLRERVWTPVGAVALALAVGVAGGVGGAVVDHVWFPNEKVSTITVAGGPASAAYTRASEARARLARGLLYFQQHAAQMPAALQKTFTRALVQKRLADARFDTAKSDTQFETVRLCYAAIEHDLALACIRTPLCPGLPHLPPPGRFGPCSGHATA